MCGIAGFLNKKRETSAQELSQRAENMALKIVHRGPDGHDVWVDQEAGIALSHRRLSIIDLSDHASQPMKSSDGRYILTFNGEIYNFQTLRKELEGQGVKFITQSDTEVLLEALAAWGVEGALEKISGMYAFAVWDKKTKNLTLAVDPLGKKPLYFGWIDDDLVFASELKCFNVFPNFQKDINRSALKQFMRHGYIPAPLSIFKNIYKLEPGTHCTLNCENPESLPKNEALPTLATKHFCMRQTSQQERRTFTSDDEAADYVQDILKGAVNRRMIADVPLGAFLSGGIDSSLVVALMQEQTSAPVKTFSIGFEEAEFDESKYARDIAQALGTDHTSFFVTPEETREVIPQLPDIYDEPFADMSQIPTWHVCRLARDHVTVALSGDGGDEFFCGYDRYFWMMQNLKPYLRIPNNLRKGMRGVLNASAHPIHVVFGGVLEKISGRKISPEKLKLLASMISSESFPELYRYMHTHWKDPSSIVLSEEPEPQGIWAENFKNLGLNEWEVMMLIDSLLYLPGDILTKVDRASMSNSLEVRCPLLDVEVVKAAWQIPIEHKVSGQSGKQVLRKILARYIDPKLFERPKMGFGVPMAVWLRGPLKEWAGDLLSKDMIEKQGLFQYKDVEYAWNAHQSGSADMNYLLWDVLMAQAWAENNRIK